MLNAGALLTIAREMQNEAEALYGEMAALKKKIARLADALREAESGQAARALDGQAVASRSCFGKRRYATPEAAGQAAGSAKRARKVMDLRIYDCPMCGGYHLTSTPLEVVVR